jgi:hypothetical protein
MFSDPPQREGRLPRSLWLGLRTAEPLVCGVVAAERQASCGVPVTANHDIGER